MAEYSYEGLAPGQIPTPGKLPFQARSVRITSGSNFVSSASQSFPQVAPGVSGAQLPLTFPSDTADFVITPPPPAPVPVGPAQVTSVTYSDQLLPYNPGLQLLSQSVAVLQSGSGLVGGFNQVNIVPGLAKAVTIYGLTDNLGPGTWSLFGTMAGGLSPLIQTLANSSTFNSALGTGTIGQSFSGTPGSAPGTGPATGHLFQELALQCSTPFVIDARIYF